MFCLYGDDKSYVYQVDYSEQWGEILFNCSKLSSLCGLDLTNIVERVVQQNYIVSLIL